MDVITYLFTFDKTQPWLSNFRSKTLYLKLMEHEMELISKCMASVFTKPPLEGINIDLLYQRRQINTHQQTRVVQTFTYNKA